MKCMSLKNKYTNEGKQLIKNLPNRTMIAAVSGSDFHYFIW